jgi:hypothetical protein
MSAQDQRDGQTRGRRHRRLPLAGVVTSLVVLAAPAT